MKKILMLGLLFSLFACEKTIVVEEEKMNNFSFEKLWIMDVPTQVITNSNFRISEGDNLYFGLYTNKVSPLKMYKINVKSKELEYFYPDFLSKNFNTNEINKLEIKNNHLFVLNNKLGIYSIETKQIDIIEGLNSNSIYDFFVLENDIFLLEHSYQKDEFTLSKLDITTMKREAITTFKQDFVSRLAVKKDINNDVLLYVQSNKGNLLYNYSKKKLVYQNTFSSINFGDVVIDEDAAYSLGVELKKINLLDGKVIWTRPTLGTIKDFSKVIFQKDVLFYFDGGSAFSLDKKSGNEIWKSNMKPDIAISVMHNYLYLSANRLIDVLDKSNGKTVASELNEYMLGYSLFTDEKNNLIYTFKEGQFCCLKGLK